MIKALVLLAFIIPFLRAKTINVAIDYDNTLDVYYNFKSNSSIIVTPISTGLEINILETGTYSNSSTQTICNILSDGMIIINVDKSESNQLITWNTDHVYHLVNPTTKSELSYDSVLLQGCASNSTQTAITLSTTSALIETAVETYIGVLTSQGYSNHTTYIPVKQYTATSNSNKATFTGYNRINNTIAVVAQAMVTTTTPSNAVYTNYSVSSVYTEVETVKSCMNHAMGGCSLVTMTNVESNGMTYTGQNVITNVYQSEYESTLLEPVATQESTSKKHLLSTQLTGNSAYASVSTQTINNESVHTSLSPVATSSSSNSIASGSDVHTGVSTGIESNESTYVSLSALASSKTTLIQQVSSVVLSSSSSLITVNTLYDGAANKVHALTRFLGLSLLLNIIL